MEKLKITTLCEDTVNKPNLMAEHGLSLLIETEEVNILFDTGQTLITVYNATKLGKDLKSINKIILTHGHYDHTGGLLSLLQIKGEVDIYGHPHVFQEKYRKTEEGELKYVGVPYRESILTNLGARFNFNSKPAEIGKGLLLTGEIPRFTEIERVDEGFRLKKGEEVIGEDPLLDDQALIIDSKQGIVVVLGCAHAGLINTLEYVAKITGERRIHTVIGGTHLINAQEERIQKTLTLLEKFNIQKIGVSHCTGLRASAMFWQEYKERFFLNNVGCIMKF